MHGLSLKSLCHQRLERYSQQPVIWFMNKYRTQFDKADALMMERLRVLWEVSDSRPPFKSCTHLHRKQAACFSLSHTRRLILSKQQSAEDTTATTLGTSELIPCRRYKLIDVLTVPTGTWKKHRGRTCATESSRYTSYVVLGRHEKPYRTLF